MSLRITEIFYSLQGETRTTGLPTVFVRLTGCPLRCQYCDTAYAFQGGQSMSLPDILASAVHFSLALNREHAPGPGKYVNHSFVTHCLKSMSNFSDVNRFLIQAATGHQFKQVAALANQSKHNSIVFPSLNADLTGSESGANPDNFREQRSATPSVSVRVKVQTA